MITKMDVVGACTTGMLLGLVLLECCWGLYYWNVVETCTNGMLLGLVLLECCWGLYYWTGVGGVYYWNVVWACTTGMWLGLVLLECCWGLYYWNVVGLVVMEFGNSYTTYASGTVVIICAPITLGFPRVLEQYKCIYCILCNLHNRLHD